MHGDEWLCIIVDSSEICYDNGYTSSMIWASTHAKQWQITGFKAILRHFIALQEYHDVKVRYGLQNASRGY